MVWIYLRRAWARCYPIEDRIEIRLNFLDHVTCKLLRHFYISASIHISCIARLSCLVRRCALLCGWIERSTCSVRVQTRVWEQWHALMLPHEIFHWPSYVIFADARNIPLYLCLQVTRLKCTFLRATNEKWEDQRTDNGEETARDASRGYKFFLGRKKRINEAESNGWFSFKKEGKSRRSEKNDGWYKEKEKYRANESFSFNCASASSRFKVTWTVRRLFPLSSSSSSSSLNSPLVKRNSQRCFMLTF